MSHSRALVMMLLATLMWSSGGVLSRQLTLPDGLEVTMWRSVFAALTVLVWGLMQHQRGGPSLAVPRQAAVWISGCTWAVAFTCFMVALSMTRVANVLLVQCLGPVLTAVLAWVVFRQPLGAWRWAAVALASVGIASIYVFDAAGLQGQHLAGMAVALGIPIAMAVNWVNVQRTGVTIDLSLAVLIGGVLSTLVMLPWAWPLEASVRDLAVLAVLGVFQLGVPCLMAMRAARGLRAPEVAVLSLLEVIFGIAWAWLFVGEQPGPAVWFGGALVLVAVAVNELSAPGRRDAVPATR